MQLTPHRHGRSQGLSRFAGRGLVTLGLVAALALPGAARAAEEPADGRITLELNGLQTVDQHCRITLVSTNGLDVDIERMVVELVLFDGDRRALRFLRVALPALMAARTRAQVFDAQDMGCEAIGAVLFNGAVECAAPGLGEAACASAIEPASRAPVPFVTGFSESSDQTTN